MNYAACASGTRASGARASGTRAARPIALISTRPVKFTKYSAEIPSSSTTTELSTNRSLYQGTETAQAQFSAKSEDLEALNTSGVIQDYRVEFADGEIVKYRHKDEPTVRFENLKAQEKPLVQQVADLQRQVGDFQRQVALIGDLQRQVQDFRNQMYTVMDYQIATNAIEGLSVKIWAQIPSQDGKKLESLHIFDFHQLRLAKYPQGTRSTGRNVTARRIYDAIQSNYRVALEKLYDIRGRCARERTSVAHPNITVADWREFLGVEFGSAISEVRTILTELETMSIRDENGRLKRLFID